MSLLPSSQPASLPTGLMIGTGEYTTGYVHDAGSNSDKGAGVVALSLFDLRRRGKLDKLLMAGTNGQKFPAIRKHLQSQIADRYVDWAGSDIEFAGFPADDVARDPDAYVKALDSMSPGDFVTVFTPDPTHFEIALQAVKRGIHVLLAKPLVKTLDEHHELLSEAAKTGALIALEVHKRWDPIYADARDRIQQLGDFSNFYSYMSQPKSQLETFKNWASGSDISYYLNAHHVDFHAWCLQGRAVPKVVYATAADGVARSQGLETEDTISLHVTWENNESGSQGMATYTSSWIAPPADVHSQQRFFYMGHDGEVTIDQAHRGFSMATDDAGYASVNPLFMKYTPGSDGEFAGQAGYGYQSIEAFVDAVQQLNKGDCQPSDFSNRLALAGETLFVTAILEAGRRSLDSGKPQQLVFDSRGRPTGFES